MINAISKQEIAKFTQNLANNSMPYTSLILRKFIINPFVLSSCINAQHSFFSQIAHFN